MTKVVIQYIIWGSLAYKIDGINTELGCYKLTLLKLLNIIAKIWVSISNPIVIK